MSYEGPAWWWRATDTEPLEISEGGQETNK
jgi:hypothetical protein